MPVNATALEHIVLYSLRKTSFKLPETHIKQGVSFIKSNFSGTAIYYVSEITARLTPYFLS